MKIFKKYPFGFDISFKSIFEIKYFVLISLLICETSGYLLNVTEHTDCPFTNLQWIRLKNNQRCVQLINDVSTTSCFYKQFYNATLTTRHRSPMNIIRRRVRRHRVHCETFVIATNNASFVEQLFGRGQRNFFAYGVIYLVMPNAFELSDSAKEYVYKSGLQVFHMRNKVHIQGRLKIYEYIDIKNVLTEALLWANETNRDVIRQYYGYFWNHPLFNKQFKNEIVFRMSLFECPPYVIYENER